MYCYASSQRSCGCGGCSLCTNYWEASLSIVVMATDTYMNQHYIVGLSRIHPRKYSYWSATLNNLWWFSIVFISHSNFLDKDIFLNLMKIPKIFWKVLFCRIIRKSIWWNLGVWINCGCFNNPFWTLDAISTWCF